MANALVSLPYFDCGVELAAAAWQLRVSENGGAAYYTVTNAAADFTTATQNLYSHLAAVLDAHATLTGNYAIYFSPAINRVAIISTVDFILNLRSGTAAEAAAAAGLGFRADKAYDATASGSVYVVSGDFAPKYIWSPQTGFTDEGFNEVGVQAAQVQDHGGGVTNAHNPALLYRTTLRFSPLERWRCRGDQYTLDGVTNYRHYSLQEFLAWSRGGRTITFFDHRLLSGELTAAASTDETTIKVAASYYDNSFTRADVWFSGTGYYAAGQRRHISTQSESGGVTSFAPSTNFTGASVALMRPTPGGTFYLTHRGLTGYFDQSVYARAPFERMSSYAEFYEVALPMIVTDWGDPS